MSNVQVPPPVGSSGQHVDALIINAATSELRQLFVVADPVSSSAMATVTTSGGLSVHVTNPSTAVTVTNPSTQVNTLSSGPILISGTVNVVSASSGLVQISGTPTVLTASSGYLVRSLSSGIVTLSSAAALSSGIVTLSSVHTFTLSSATSLSSGTVTLSSAPLVIVASSGGTIPVTLSTVFSLSSVPTVTTTAATNPWSSAPSFNLPIVSVSSGLVQISGTATIVSASSGLVQLTSAPLVVVATSGGTFKVGTTSDQNITSLVTSSGQFAPVTSSYGFVTIGPSALTSSRLIVATSVSKISSAPGVLWNMFALSTSVAATGAYMRLYDQTTGNATSSSNSGLAGAAALFRIASSVASMPYEESFYWPAGIRFGTACSFDIVVNATSTAANAIAGWVTAQYTSS